MPKDREQSSNQKSEQFHHLLLPERVSFHFTNNMGGVVWWGLYIIFFFSDVAEAIESSVDPPMTQIERKYKTRDFKFAAVLGRGFFGKARK